MGKHQTGPLSHIISRKISGQTQKFLPSLWIMFLQAAWPEHVVFHICGKTGNRLRRRYHNEDSYRPVIKAGPRLNLFNQW
jgi:hypothetical protein